MDSDLLSRGRTLEADWFHQYLKGGRFYPAAKIEENAISMFRIWERSMSILGTMMSKKLGKPPAAAASAASVAGSAPQAAAPANANVPGAQSPTIPTIDVGGVLDALKDKAGQELNWKTSIVDLMKLLSMDSSFTARKELAKELHYDGDTADSASMNVWLHKQIMKKIAENGGKLPDDLKHG